MRRKGVWLLTILLGLCLGLGGLTPSWAGEMDAKQLINLLQKKGIITQEEANSLMEEARSNAAKEKTEIKSEIKEDMKEVAKKGEFLPPALKGFKFGTTIFAEWNAKTTQNGTSTNQFALNRGYATLTKDINEWLGMNITSDLFTSKDVNDKGQGLELRLKYAHANLFLLGTTSQLGLIPTPSDAYDSAIWPYRVQGKNLLDDLGIQASADLGISNQGFFGGLMDDEYLKFASRQYAGKWGGYHVGVFNGPGYSNVEANTNKVISGLVYFRPAPTVPVLKGLQFAYNGTYGSSNSNFTAKGQTNDYPALQVNVGQVSLQHQYFTIMGQYYWGQATTTSTEENKRRGYLVDGFVRIPGVEKLRVFGKWYNFDPNTDVDNDDYSTTVAGISYDWTKEFMPFVAWEHRTFSSSKFGNDYDMVQVGFQLKF
ncbi:MAG: hypothetical protein WA974_12350 [Thermodesulfobacteriota bacterium]